MESLVTTENEQHFPFLEYWEKVSERQGRSFKAMIKDRGKKVSEESFEETLGLLSRYKELGEKKFSKSEIVFWLKKNFFDVEFRNELYLFPDESWYPLVIDLTSLGVIWCQWKGSESFQNFALIGEEMGVITFKNLVAERRGQSIDFEGLPLPMALLSDRGDLIFYNQKFIEVGTAISDWSSKQKGEFLSHDGEVYQIDKRSIVLEELSYDLFTLNKLEKGNEKGHQDLGIISSSIAHELNNPIAAILASLAVLELEEEGNEELGQTLIEMKSCALRCKELVDLFLGFSRAQVRTEKLGEVQHSFEQAIGLVRFRAIEEGTNLRPEFRIGSSPLARKKNRSMMSMLLYLVFNEVLNEYRHHSLVREGRVEALGLEVVENSKDITVEIKGIDEEKVISRLRKVKLLTSMLAMLNFEMKTSPRGVKFVEFR